MNTDKTWQWYGENDPYYGVLTEDSFRGGNLTLERKRAFFESGQKHISDLLRGLEETHMPIKKDQSTRLRVRGRQIGHTFGSRV